MDHAINLLVSAILTFAALVMEAVGLVDAFLAALMTHLGVPANAQIILLVVAAIWLTIMAFRVFGQLFAALIIILLVLLIFHHLLPHDFAPTPNSAGAVHI